MKKYISTKFFRELKKASQGACYADNGELKKDYGEFTKLIFSEESAYANKVSYRNSLVNIRVELSGFSWVQGGKYENLCKQSHRTC